MATAPFCISGFGVAVLPGSRPMWTIFAATAHSMYARVGAALGPVPGSVNLLIHGRWIGAKP